MAEHHEFPRLKAFGRIEATREIDGVATSLATVLAHWAIENALHWQLDVSFREDAARNRKNNGPANIAILRRRALDAVRRDLSS